MKRLQRTTGGSVSVRIIIVLAVSILLIEGVILGFSATSQRQTLLDHYLFEAAIIAKTLGPGAEAVQNVDVVESRLESEKVMDIRRVDAAESAQGGEEAGGAAWKSSRYGGEHLERGDQLFYRLNNLEIVIDISQIPAMVASYAARIIGLVVLIVVFVTGAVYFLLRPQVVTPLRRLEARLAEISGSEADLTERLPVDRRDEIGRISERFNEFSEKLRQIVQTVQSNATQLSESFAQLSGLTNETDENASANLRLVKEMRDELSGLDKDLQSAAPSVRSISQSIASMAGSAEKQDEAAGESLAAVEEMDASIRNLDGIAREKKELTDSLVSQATDAGERMNQSVEAIGSVEASTKDMLEMIDVINDVAERTSLLSMNAAIEAAHAGEAGKGFAVVAEEIRKLSEVSSENATKIDSSLKKDIDAIHKAGEINRATQEVIGRFVENVQQVASSMAEIMNGLNEQATASSDIVQSISSIRELTASVREESSSIQSEAEAIDSTIQSLASASNQVSANADEATRRTESIAESTGQVNEIVQSGSQGIHKLSDQVGQFRTGDSEQDPAK
jgi:methyl-accepting chemotaxis protein